MKLIKRHKGLAIVGCLALILLIIIFAIFARMIFSGSDSAYGDRLNSLAKIDNKVTTKIINETKELDEVKDITIRTQGKILYMTITYKEGTKLNKAKEIAAKTFTEYDESVLECYDFEYLITEEVDNSEEEEKTGFSAAGTKIPESDTISWTKS